MVADRILEHSELGLRLLGFTDDRLGETDAVGHRGLPVLGTVAETAEVCLREKVDTIYVALPIEEHVKMLGVVEFASRECIDVNVVPDLLQFIALKARLEDLDGLPIISINDVPLRGINSVVKRLVDVLVSTAVLVVFTPFGSSSRGSSSAARPARSSTRRSAWGWTASAFTVYKFRTMPMDAEELTGPIWARAARSAGDAYRALAAPARRGRAAAVLERLQAATCRSSGRARSGPSSSSSSSTGSRSTCCATR